MVAAEDRTPATRYARSGDTAIAYQVLGDGPIDVIMVPGFPSHLELMWENPRIVHFYRRLASFSRLIVMDKRGMGLSDRVPDAELPGLEQRMDDVRAVLDDAGSERAAAIGVSDGGPLAALFAATHPNRTERLVLINTYAKRIRSHDHPWGPSVEEWERFQEAIRDGWGTPLFVDMLAPDRVADEEFKAWWSRFLRQSVSPGGAISYLRMNARLDVRAALPSIHVPTLILHRVDDMINPVAGARFMAAEIPDARVVELPGADHHPYMGDAEAILDAVEEFLTGDRPRPVPRAVLSTLLFTDIVASTQTAAAMGDRRWGTLLETHDDIVRAELQRFGGREVKTTGDGFLAMFDGPARAVRCGLALVDRLGELGVAIRAGVHTSEVEVVDGDLRGIGVHLAARIMGLAEPQEVVVSSVVRDLALGSGLEFDERGRHVLKGVPGEWAVFRASSGG